MFRNFSNVLIVRKTCLPWNLLKNLFSKKASNSIKHKISSAKLSIFIYPNNKLCIFSQSQKLVLQFLLNISESQKLIPQKKTVLRSQSQKYVLQKLMSAIISGSHISLIVLKFPDVSDLSKSAIVP